MSRSYIEWRNAYNSWKASYYAGISALQPNPQASIVYTERSTNPFWERRQNRTEDKIGLSILNVSENLPELQNIGQHLIDIGRAEFQKEQKTLQQMMPDITIASEEDELNFIKQFNIFLQGEAHYKLMIERLDKVLNKNKGKKSLAPIVSSLFTSYLGTALNQNIIPILRSLDASQNFSIWESALNNAVDKSIEQAFEKMLSAAEHKNNEIFGSADEYKDILQMWKNDPLLRTQFKDTIRSKINFEKIFSDLQKNTLWQQRAKAGKKVGMRSALIDSKQGLNLGNRAGQIGGSVYEYIQSMFRDSNLSGTITESGTRLKGQVISGEIARTDSVLVFSYDTTINIDDIVKDLNESISSSTSLIDARDRISEFYDRNLKSLKQGFIIYDSAKAYGTSVNEKGFKNGQELPLERLGDYASDAGVPLGSIQDFLLTAYNTLNGAIYDAARDTVKVSIENILYAAAAKLLFDDWTSIGEDIGNGSQVTALHVFPLSGIYVPASYLLRNIGQALINADKDYRKWIDIKVTLPKTKTYEPKTGTGMPPDKLIGKSSGSSDLEIKQRILEEWNKQFQTAKSESEFSVHFLRNFKDLIAGLAKI